MIQPANKSKLPPVVHSSTRRPCDELGLCQNRQPACPGCGRHDTLQLPSGYHFAPGVIEGDSPMQRRAGLRAALRWVSWVATAAVISGALVAAAYGIGHAWARFGGAL